MKRFLAIGIILVIFISLFAYSCAGGSYKYALVSTSGWDYLTKTHVYAPHSSYGTLQVRIIRPYIFNNATHKWEVGEQEVNINGSCTITKLSKEGFEKIYNNGEAVTQKTW